MRDGASGRSRGFGFLTFRDPKTVNTVMVKEHFLDGKIVSCTQYTELIGIDPESRSTRSVRFPATSKRKPARSSWAG